MPDKTAADSREMHSRRLAEILGRFPSKVTTCHVVDVEVTDYCGPVYDISTQSSLYVIGNGVVSSNCRCTMTFRLTDAYEQLLAEHGSLLITRALELGSLGPEPKALEKIAEGADLSLNPKPHDVIFQRTVP